MRTFCTAKVFLIFFSTKYQCIWLYRHKTLNDGLLTSWSLNELVKPTMLWTTGPWWGVVHPFSLVIALCLYGYLYTYANNAVSEQGHNSIIPPLAENANFSAKYYSMGTFWRSTFIRVVQNSYTIICPPVREIIYSLKLLDFLLVKADKPWYNSDESLACRDFKFSYVFFLFCRSTKG